ncbi:MAG TPA: PQQ-dependent sugar dehydrogenase [Asticcacaulis sp.]|nr:PQQ-dependent sugar dehydrogenase [Asticcacaulis sp.]
MKTWIPALAVGALSLAAPIAAGAPSLGATAPEIIVPQGFRATVVFDGEGPARHIAFNSRGDLYVSSQFRNESAAGTPIKSILALRDTDHDGRFDDAERFSTVKGTGIRFHEGHLYVTSATNLYRYSFQGDELTPSEPPEVLVAGLPEEGFSSRAIAFDDHGGVFISIGASGNVCTDKPGLEGKPLDPCPDLADRAGIWRYDAGRTGQKHPIDGERYATGVRDTQALAWDAADQNLYTVLQGRNGLNNGGSKQYSADDSAKGVAEEMHRVTKGANLGWPYSHFDGRTMQRLMAPEYGGGPGDVITDQSYATPVAVFPAHSSPLDIVFYDGGRFPVAYRGGAFVAFQGGFGGVTPQNGYNVWFVPRSPGKDFAEPVIFADGFAGSERMPQTAKYRPSGLAIAPNGALYIVESKTGRIWRIDYQEAAE